MRLWPTRYTISMFRGESYRPVKVRRNRFLKGKWFAVWFGDRIRIGRNG
jgi:hypothetical protein